LEILVFKDRLLNLAKKAENWHRIIYSEAGLKITPFLCGSSDRALALLHGIDTKM
jgi:hypothetical protein